MIGYAIVVAASVLVAVQIVVVVVETEDFRSGADIVPSALADHP